MIKKKEVSDWDAAFDAARRQARGLCMGGTMMSRLLREEARDKVEECVKTIRRKGYAVHAVPPEHFISPFVNESIIRGHERKALEYIMAMAVDKIVNRGQSLPRPTGPTVMFHGPATIVFWPDGTKTAAVCHEDYDPDGYIDCILGFCIAYFKKHSGMSKNQRKKLFEHIWNEKPFIAMVNGKAVEMGKDPVGTFFESFFRSHYGGTVADQNAVLQRVEGGYGRYCRKNGKPAPKEAKSK